MNCPLCSSEINRSPADKAFGEPGYCRRCDVVITGHGDRIQVRNMRNQIVYRRRQWAAIETMTSKPGRALPKYDGINDEPMDFEVPREITEINVQIGSLT